MEKLIKNPNFLMIGAGVLAFAITNMIMNRKSKVTAQNEFSNFFGTNCKCSNGFYGNCASGNCKSCCGKMGFDEK